VRVIQNLFLKREGRVTDSTPAQLALQKKLNEAFAETQGKNPLFSLRAFARRLELSPSALSEILKGKRRVSKKLALRVVENLGLPNAESERLLSLFPERQMKNREKSPYQTPMVQLPRDQYQIIAEWYHFAILSLAELPGFVLKPEWISRRLNITTENAEGALERLERLGLLVRDAQGVLQTSGLDYTTPDEVKESSLRKAHHTNFELAKLSLDRDSMESRDFTATTMAIDVSRLPAAKKMIREFQDRLSVYLEGGTKNEVYKICVQLFPVSIPADATSFH